MGKLDNGCFVPFADVGHATLVRADAWPEHVRCPGQNGQNHQWLGARY
jgi:hypothetical protein